MRIAWFFITSLYTLVLSNPSCDNSSQCLAPYQCFNTQCEILFAGTCKRDVDCSSLHHCDDGKCEHKSLFPIQGLEVIGTIMTILISGLSNAAGIGGGPLNTITTQVFFGFDTYRAVAFSQVAIFGGSLMSVALKIPARHPTKDRPLLDYELVAYLIAPLLSGTSIGVAFHLIFPDWLTVVLLVILLIYVSYKTTRKGINIYKAETKHRISFDSINPEAGPEVSILDKEPEEVKEENEELKKHMEEDKKIVPVGPACTIGLIYSIVLLASFVKGGKGVDSIIGISQCSAGYWIFLIIYFIALLIITWHLGNNLIAKTQQRIEANYDFDESDPKWNKKSAIIIGSVTFAAGIAAGSLGIGGGLIMNPFMLALGIRPEISTACSNLMVLFSSSISFLQYCISGIIKFDYGIWLFISSLCGSLLGFLVIKQILKKINRPSVIILLLAFMLTASLVGIFVTGIATVIDEEYYGFSSMC